MGKCLLCGGNHCSSKAEDGALLEIKCQSYNASFRLDTHVPEIYGGSETLQRMLNLMAERVLHESKDEDGGCLVFYCDENETGKRGDKNYVNLAYELPNYPRTIEERVNRALMNLSLRFPHYGAAFTAEDNLARLCFASEPEGEEETNGVIRMLVDFGYVERLGGNRGAYNITAEGWKKVEGLKASGEQSRQAFVAMSFCEKTAPMREAIRRSLAELGYAAVLIDEKEHNGQIVPEILHEIRKSRFMVTDVTYPNFGAYYEAGYAMGQGKEVIVCCKRSCFESDATRPHFDIAQKSIVIWDDEEDLAKRLKRRIEATVQ